MFSAGVNLAVLARHASALSGKKRGGRWRHRFGYASEMGQNPSPVLGAEAGLAGRPVATVRRYPRRNAFILHSSFGMAEVPSCQQGWPSLACKSLAKSCRLISNALEAHAPRTRPKSCGRTHDLVLRAHFECFVVGRCEHSGATRPHLRSKYFRPFLGSLAHEYRSTLFLRCADEDTISI